jgi:hypothetical protein
MMVVMNMDRKEQTQEIEDRSKRNGVWELIGFKERLGPR